MHPWSQCTQEVPVTQKMTCYVQVGNKENFWIKVILTTKVDLNYDFKSAFF